MTIEYEIRRTQIITHLQKNGFHYDGLSECSRRLDHPITINKEIKSKVIGLDINTGWAAFQIDLNRFKDRVEFYSASAKVVSKGNRIVKITYELSVRFLTITISELPFDGIRMVFKVE